MTVYVPGSQQQPFPVERPVLTVQTGYESPFELDCRELLGWFGVPEVGEFSLWAVYDAPDWQLTGFTELQGVRLAKVHDRAGVELAVRAYEHEAGWDDAPHSIFARVTRDEVEWLGTLFSDRSGARVLRSFQDLDPTDPWRGNPRRFTADRFEVLEDGVLQQRPAGLLGHPFYAAVGTALVRVGERQFSCLRVIGVDPEPQCSGVLFEAFITRQGRTVLLRRYNGTGWGCEEAAEPWDQRLPDNERLTVDGVEYIHWFDSLSHRALGIQVGEE